MYEYIHTRDLAIQHKSSLIAAHVVKLPVFLKLTNTDTCAAWFVVTGDATPDGTRVVRSLLEAISPLLIVTFLRIAAPRRQP